MRIACWILKVTNTHTLRLCNTHCFSTATMVARTRLNAILYVHWLYCYKVKSFFTSMLCGLHVSLLWLIEVIPLCGIIKSIINSIEISVNTTLTVGLKLQHVSTLGGHHQVELIYEHEHPPGQGEGHQQKGTGNGPVINVRQWTPIKTSKTNWLEHETGNQHKHKNCSKGETHRKQHPPLPPPHRKQSQL